jgi:predicted enzyme related to lactoylglutathione lyase
VTISHLFARLAVSDFAAARAWYEALFGRPPDLVPEEGEAVWHASASGSIYITADPDRAGSCAVTMAVRDLDAHAAGLVARGLSHAGPVTAPSGPRRVIVTDDDGNAITFFQDPVEIS